MKTFSCLLLLLMAYQVIANDLEVLVRVITTTSIEIEWHNASFGHVSYIHQLVGDPQKNETEFLTTSNQTIRLIGLIPGQKYGLVVKDEEDEWHETITTASCPENWFGFGMSCYVLSENEMSWNSASIQCSAFNSAHLAHPRSTPEIDFIRQLLNEPNDGKTKPLIYWVGVHDKNKDDNVTYSNGSPVSSDVSPFWNDCTRSDGGSVNCISLVTASWNNPRQPACVFRSCTHGEAGSVCQVTVSDSPHRVRVSSRTREADVSWEKPPSLYGSSFQWYNVTLTLSDQTITETRLMDANQTNTTFTDLVPGSLYTVLIHTEHQLDGEALADGGRFPSSELVTKPLRPNNLTSTHIAPTTATISWSHPMDQGSLSNFHGFVVTYHAAEGSNYSNFTNSGRLVVGPNVQKITLENLEPLVRFQVTVSSFVEYDAKHKGSHIVESRPSNHVIFQTLVSPPLSFHVTHFTSYSITLEWDRALGDIDYYLITLQDTEIMPNISQAEYPNNITSTVFDQLTPGAAYYVTIFTYQYDNTSEVIELFQRTRPLPVAPAQVNANVKSTSVHININRYQSDLSVYDGYNLTLASFEPQDIIGWRIVKNVTSSWDSGTVSRLTPGRSYQLTIWVTSGDVRSDPSKIKNFTIGLQPPKNLRVKSRDETSLRLQWDPAPGDFENYLVSCDGDVGYNCSRQFEEVERDDGEELLIENLVPGALYHFTVVALQKLRRSEKAELATRTLPNSPTDVRLMERNTTSVTLRWQPAKHKQDKYRIEYRPVSNGVFYSGASPSDGFLDILVATPPSSPLSQVITGLLPGSSYDLSIKTGSGEIWSKPAEMEVATYPEAIHSLESTDIGATWVALSWEQGEGGAESYKLMLSTEAVFLPANQSTPRHTFDMLTPASFYTIQVSSLANGDESSPTELTIISRPLPPNDVTAENVTETFFTLKWNAPDSVWENYLITITYVINATHGDPNLQPDDFITLQYRTDEEAMTLDSLPAGGLYVVQVQSEYSDVKSSPVSLNITTYPYSPDNLTVLKTSTKQIYFQWTEPSGLNGGFEIEWTPKDGQVSLTQGGAILDDLTPGRGYSVRVHTLSVDRLLRSRSPASFHIFTDEDEPGSPTNLTLTSHNNSSIGATWSPPNNPNGILLFYILRYQQLYPRPNINHEVINISASHLSVNITGLEPGAGYYVSVASQNSAGVGEFTQRHLVQVVEGTPGPVEQLQATSLSSSSISISWNPPQSPNGIITLYVVSVEDSNGNFVDGYELFLNEEDDVGCLNDDVTAEDLLYFLNETSLASPEHNGASHEWVEERSAGDASSTHERIQEALLNGEFLPWCPVRVEIKGLLPYQSYHVSVWAWTAAEEGQMEHATVVTDQDVPGGPPTNLKVSSIGDRNITLKWDPPLMPNGLLIYTIMLFAKDLSDDVMLQTNNTQINLVELEPFTSYAVTMKAASGAGDGSWSDLLNVHTSQGASGLVNNYRVAATSSRSIAVNWSSPIRPHGVVTAYVINVYDVNMGGVLQQAFKVMVPANTTGSFKVSQPSVPGGEREENSSLTPLVNRDLLGSLLTNVANESYGEIINNLHPYTEYNVSVAAENSAGIGAYVTGSVVTHEDVPASPLVNVSYTNLTSTSVNITWDDPIEANGVITTCTVGVVSPNEGIIKYETEKKYFVLGNLQKYSLYEVYIWPWTKVGEGPSTPKLLMHTDEDVPDTAPLNVTYTNISSSAIEVQWVAPNIPNGRIAHYTVYYSRGDEILQLTSNITSVILDKLQPYGLYHITVTASTRVGEGPRPSDAIWARLMEGQPATPPHNLNYRNITSGQVEVTWLAPSSPNGIIQFYDVNLTHSLRETNYTLLQTSDQTPAINISSLEPYNQYSVVIRANTKYGNGDQESAPLYIWTMEDVPDSAPRELRYENLTSSSIRMTWLPPLLSNGRITNYTLSYRHQFATDSDQFSVSGEDNQAVIAGLKKYTKYLISISSSTLVGQGPNAELEVITDEDVPSSPPRDVIFKQLSSTSILFTWEPPLKPNGVILMYNLFYSNNTLSLVIESAVSNVTLTNLRKHGQYDAYVTARTRLGDGDQKSEIFSFQTLEDAPSDPPSNLVVEAATSTSFDASWKPPKIPNGRIQYYTLFYKLDNSTTKSIDVIGASSTNIKLDGLKKWSWYTLWVTASTGVGDGGLKSDDVRARTLEDVPDFPVANLTATSLSSASIEASWRPTLPLTGSTYYKAFVSLLSSHDDRIYEVTTPGRNLTASKLRPFTTYTVTVIPRVTGVDKDGPSNEVRVTTKEDLPASSVQHLQYHELTSSSIRLKWNPPLIPNGVITQYEIVIMFSRIQQHIPGNSTSATIDGLQPHSNYTAVVWSYTSVGKGPKDQINFTTLQDIPSDSPRNLKIYKISATSAMLSWRTPLSPNGVITDYVMRISSGDDVNVLKSRSTSLNLTNLLPYTVYSVSVAASTTAGTGPFSHPTEEFATLESTPTEPRSVSCQAVSEHKLRVGWEAPRHPNGVLTHYMLMHEQARGEESPASVELPPLAENHEIDNLKPFTRYVIRIAAATEVGRGLFATCDLTTFEGYPGPPQLVNITGIGETTLDLTWQAPIHVNGRLLGYTLSYSPSDGCDDNNGVESLLNNETNRCLVDVANFTNIQLRFLKTYTQYTVSVRAETGRGLGSFSDPPIRQQTSEGAPNYPPASVHAMSLLSTTINVTWEKPLVLAGVTKYRVTATNVKTQEIKTSGVLAEDQRVYIMDDLAPDSSYQIVVEAITSKGSLASSSVPVVTLEDSPFDSPTDLSLLVSAGNSSSATILFRPPMQPNGLILSYHIQYKKQESESVVDVMLSRDDLAGMLSNSSDYYWPIHGLVGGKAYTFHMRASTKVGVGPWSMWTNPVATPITAPPVPSIQPGLPNDSSEEESITSVSITLSYPCVFSEVNGPIAIISIIITEEGADASLEPTTWYRAYPLSPSPPYKVIVTTNPPQDCPGLHNRGNNEISRRRRQIENNDQGFVVGSEPACSDDSAKVSCNGPLKPDTAYRVKYRAETLNGDFTETVYSEPIRTKPSLLAANMNLIIGVVVAVVLLVAAIIIVYFVIIRKRRRNAFDKTPDSENVPRAGPASPSRSKVTMAFQGKGPTVETTTHTNKGFAYELAGDDKVCETSSSRPVCKMEFGSHVAHLCLNQHKGFADEFTHICALPVEGSTTAGDKACNRTKNRLSTMLPFDHRRVIMKEAHGVEGSDYVNASYVTGESSDHQYIASQLPMRHTKADFWRMIWECGASSIVMLSNSKEDLKRDDCFWPRKRTELIGLLSIHSMEEEVHAEWITRRFNLTMGKESRDVIQFHFLKWPEVETPDGAKSVLRFIHEARACLDRADCPLVVMCSSGSGKSGVFICLDRILDQLRLRSHVDVFGVVASVRTCRTHMVETLNEYILIHRCVYEAINHKVMAGTTPTGDGMEETVF